MKEKAGLISSAKFGLIIVLFLMPFVNVSCSGMVNIPLSGMDLATGKTIEMKEPFSGKVQRQKIDPEPLAAIALGCAVLGLLVGFVKARPARLLNAAFGGGGAVLLLLLKNKIDSEVMKEGGGIIALNYEFAFWATLILFFVAAAMSMYFFSLTSEVKNE